MVRPKHANNGTLVICPKSHKSSHPFIEAKGYSKTGKGRLTQRLIPMDIVESFTHLRLSATEKDLALMHPRLIHSSTINESDKPSYVSVFKVWNNSLDYTISPSLGVLPYHGDDILSDIKLIKRPFPSLLIE